jgi:hypothetical protein
VSRAVANEAGLEPLRTKDGTLQVLFSFEPRRQTVQLADDLNDEYLPDLGEKGVI